MSVPILRIDNLVKGFWRAGAWHPVIRGLSLAVPRGMALGLLGRNGVGKTTLLDLIAGTMRPDQGRVQRVGQVSFPVGFAAGFHRDLSGAQNIRFLARIYGADPEALVAFVQDFAELGPQFHDPLRSYSTGMRARLAFGASMGLPFDLYLIDEATSVGDARFRQKSKALFRARMNSASGIMVSHNMQDLTKYCDAGLVLHDGRVWFFDRIEDAIEAHQDLQNGRA
ncbi:MAG: ABC transporter ATP-binding protein [Roseinatronobacter sp.]